MGGKKAAANQAASMREMNRMAQDQFDYYKEEQRKQKIVVDEQREQYEAFDFENPFGGIQNPYRGLETDFQNLAAGAKNVYAGMENPYEDLTVDMKAAEFQAQQGAQQRANILSTLRGSAGSSGVAGLAQALANQGALQAQQISATIGQQETANQRLAAQGEMQIQRLQRAGEADVQKMRMAGAQQARGLQLTRENMIAQGGFQADTMRMQGDAAVQQAEFGRESTMLGMEYGLLGGASQALSSAMGNQMSAMGMQSQMYGAQAQAQSGLVGSLVGTAGSVTAGHLIAGKTVLLCVPKGTNIDSVNTKILIEDIKPGDIVIGYSGKPVKVLQKHEYLEDPEKERFYKVEFNNGSIVTVCDMHRIRGERAKDITENVKSKEVYGGVQFSYDLLTEDQGYMIDSTPVNSMIGELAEEAIKIKNK